jgi:hypothetical protein
MSVSDDVSIVEVKPFISAEQIDALKLQLEMCPKDYLENVTSWIMRNRGGFEKLEMNDYEALLERAQKKAQETNEAQAA